jgi:hypothetical protein
VFVFDGAAVGFFAKWTFRGEQRWQGMLAVPTLLNGYAAAKLQLLCVEEQLQQDLESCLTHAAAFVSAEPILMWTFYWTAAGAPCSGRTAAAACTMFEAAEVAAASIVCVSAQHKQQH